MRYIFFFTDHASSRPLLIFYKALYKFKTSGQHGSFQYIYGALDLGITKSKLYYISKKEIEWSPSQFLKQSFFSIFSLFLKVGEVCNNSNKC